MVVEQAIELRSGLSCEVAQGRALHRPARSVRGPGAHTVSISARSSGIFRNLPTSLSQGYMRLLCAAVWMSHFIHTWSWPPRHQLIGDHAPGPNVKSTIRDDCVCARVQRAENFRRGIGQAVGQARMVTCTLQVLK